MYKSIPNLSQFPRDHSLFDQRYILARLKNTSSPFNAITVHGITSPKVKDSEIVQKCPSVVVSALRPITFIPKNPATKLIGRNKMVTIVKTKIALLLSSWNVSTNWTFWTACNLARSINSSQFFICSWIFLDTMSMALHSKQYLSLRVILGVLNVFGSSDARSPVKTLTCSVSTSFTIVTSS